MFYDKVIERGTVAIALKLIEKTEEFRENLLGKNIFFLENSILDCVAALRVQAAMARYRITQTRFRHLPTFGSRDARDVKYALMPC